MSFQRTKRIGNHEYLYEQESYKENGQTKSRHVRYIGKVSSGTMKTINADIKDEAKANKDYKELSKELGTTDARKVREIAKEELQHKKELENIKSHSVVVNHNKFHSVHKSHDNNPFDKKVEEFALNRHMIITIPSTQGDKHIKQKEIDARARDVATNMTNKFGGSTRIKGEGQYERKDNKKIDDENVVKVEVFMSKAQWNKEQPKIQKYILGKQKAWNQETIGVEYDKSSTMYFIRQPKKENHNDFSNTKHNAHWKNGYLNNGKRHDRTPYTPQEHDKLLKQSRNETKDKRFIYD